MLTIIAVFLINLFRLYGIFEVLYILFVIAAVIFSLRPSCHAVGTKADAISAISPFLNLFNLRHLRIKIYFIATLAPFALIYS